MTSPQGAPDFVPANVSVPADTPLATGINLSIPAGGTPTVGTWQFTSPSYLITVNLQQSAAATNPAVQLQLFWTDPVTGLIVAEEAWTLIAATGAPSPSIFMYTGRGPTLAGELQVQATVADPAQGVTLGLAVYQSSRDVGRAVWRTNFLPGVPVYTLPFTDAAGLILAAQATTSLAAAGNVTVLCALWAGQAGLLIRQTGGMQLTVTVQATDPQFTGQPFIYQTVSAAATDYVVLVLPRCPVVLSITNNGASSTGVAFSLVALEQNA